MSRSVGLCLLPLLLVGNAAWAAEPAAETVPLRVDQGVVFFDVMLDGKGPFAFILDPAAAGGITADTLRKLGRSDAETAQVGVAVGSLQLGKLPLRVFDGDGAYLDPKHDPAAGPIAGTLGPELLARYAMRLDYTHASLGLTPLATFRYRGHGQALPLVFHDVMPLILASADGITGLFAYDVRAPGRLMLFHPFLARNGFLSRYGVQPDAAHPSIAGVLHTLGVAGVTLREQPANFAGYTSGKFAATDEAGVLGYDVLSQFITTADYRHKLIYFEPVTPRD
ncbi:MAG TPA: hypothetical protein VGH71_03975 [Gammaproteobacteria bacterium]|jgi:hypothetical protein